MFRRVAIGVTSEGNGGGTDAAPNIFLHTNSFLFCYWVEEGHINWLRVGGKCCVHTETGSNQSSTSSWLLRKSKFLIPIEILPPLPSAVSQVTPVTVAIRFGIRSDYKIQPAVVCTQHFARWIIQLGFRWFQLWIHTKPVIIYRHPNCQSVDVHWLAYIALRPHRRVCHRDSIFSLTIRNYHLFRLYFPHYFRQSRHLIFRNLRYSWSTLLCVPDPHMCLSKSFNPLRTKRNRAVNTCFLGYKNQLPKAV